MLPWWRRAMLDYRVRHTGWSDWLRRNARTLRQVRDAIARNGPMANADFEGRRAGGGAGWWNWKPVQHALHYLWMSGALAIHSRRHFHKRFDLLERAMPAAAAADAVTSDEFRRWHVERALHAMGAATLTDVAGYLTFPRFGPGGRRPARGAHFEPWCAAERPPPTERAAVDREAALAGLADALGSLATFVGASEVTIDRVTPGRLRPPLARALRGT